MSTDAYKYLLKEKSGSHTIYILLNDVPGPFNDWEEGEPSSGCLIVGNGPIKTDNAGQHCLSGGAGSSEVLVIRGASWSSKAGDSGDAELFLYQNSTPYYTWTLTSVVTK